MLQIKEIYIRWVGIPILALFTMFLMPHEATLPYLLDYVVHLCFTAFYWNAMVFAFRRYQKIFPEMKYYGKRLFFTVLTIILIVIIGNPLIALAVGLINFEQMYDSEIVFEHIPQILLISFMMASFYETAYFFDKYRESARNFTDLKAQQLKDEFEVLQNQMSPHFLFNSLNTLNTLIQEDPNLAEKFTEHLSDVYRYILMNKGREVVPLEEEVNFVKSYVYLLQIRYPDNLNIHFHVDKVIDTYIPPLTLQILVENAVKHNAISNKSPLTVEIYASNGNTLVVKNNVKVKNTLGRSTQTGLANLRKRYRLINNREIEVIKTPNMFMVVVPLFSIELEQTLFEKINAQ